MKILFNFQKFINYYKIKFFKKKLIETSSYLFLVMELVKAGTLIEYI